MAFVARDAELLEADLVAQELRRDLGRTDLAQRPQVVVVPGEADGAEKDQRDRDDRADEEDGDCCLLTLLGLDEAAEASPDAEPLAGGVCASSSEAAEDRQDQAEAGTEGHCAAPVDRRSDVAAERLA